MQCDFRLAIVKGLVEHNQGDAYFGSLMGYTQHFNSTIAAGWVTRDGERETLTDEGRDVYVKCNLASLPNQIGRRAYMWDWSVIPDPASMKNPSAKGGCDDAATRVTPHRECARRGARRKP